MKKFVTMMFFAVLAVGAATAQESKTVTGYVVDKNGNPLAGAEVVAAGGGSSTISDADGSFTLNVHPLLKKLTASYAGMDDKTIKLNKASNLIFTMTPEKKHPVFLSAIGCIGIGREKDEEDGTDTPILYGSGIMGGQLGKWGWYGKALMMGDEYSDSDMTTFRITAGAIKQLGQSSTYLYVGAGVEYDDDWSGLGIAADIGAIFKVSQHVNIVAGLNYSHGSGSYSRYKDDYWYDTKMSSTKFLLNIGVGYVF